MQLQGGAGALQVAVYVGAGEFQVGDVPTRPPRRSYHYIWWPRRGGREPRRRTGGTLLLVPALSEISVPPSEGDACQRPYYDTTLKLIKMSEARSSTSRPQLILLKGQDVMTAIMFVAECTVPMILYVIPSLISSALW